MKLFENVGKNGFPVERRVSASRVEHVFSKYRKTEKSNGVREDSEKSKVCKGIAKFNWKKRIQVVPASAKMYYAVLTDVAST